MERSLPVNPNAEARRAGFGRTEPEDIVRTYPWAIWGVAVFAYAVAVMERSSFGVAGIEAAQRFGASAGITSTFVVLQLLVYAVMQIPAGVLLDRFGSRIMIAAGCLLMAAGQGAFAFSASLPMGMAARVLVGVGDALIFGAALRLVPAWFAPKNVPLMMQLTGLMGQFGQIGSAIGVVALLHLRGWTPTFLTTAAIAVIAAICTLTLVRNAPAGSGLTSPQGGGPRGLGREVVEIMRHPGTALGFWTHLAAGFAGVVFAMMWGIPYLVAGEGRSPATASALMTLFVVASAFFGPVVGVLTARHPLRRSNLVLAIIAGNALPWLAVLVWPGPAPLWLLVVLMIGLAAGGPGTGIGFDYARSFHPPHRLGTATGVVIMGSFVGGVACILLIGLALDAMAPGGQPTLGQYRWAMAIQLPFFAVGLVGLLVSRRKMRRLAAASGVIVPPWREVLEREIKRRRR